MAPEQRWSTINYLKLLTAIVFISMAIITTTTVQTFRSSKTNHRILTLVEQCVVEGECGPSTDDPAPGTVKVINYMIDAIGCILLVDPPARKPEDIQRCKLETAPKG